MLTSQGILVKKKVRIKQDRQMFIDLEPENSVYEKLTISDAALKRIAFLISKNPDMIGIRLNVKKYGCAGFTYRVEKVVDQNPDDRIYKCGGIKIYISSKIVPLISGIRLDFVQNEVDCSFQFSNPKAKYICGCGKSFGV